MRTNIHDLALLLLTLRLNKSPVKGRKRIQKTVCILKYGYMIPFGFDFRPYFYGPYSDQLAESLETLCASNLVKESFEAWSAGAVQYQYSLTEFGERLCNKLLQAPDGKSLAVKIEKAMDEIRNSPTQELVVRSKELLADSTHKASYSARS